MMAFIFMSAIGVFVCVLGVMNMLGNITTLHRYHRHRVTKDDEKPLGKLVGLGSIIIGVSLTLCGVLFWISESTLLSLYANIGAGLVIAGIIIGLALSLYGIIKYNKGLF